MKVGLKQHLHHQMVASRDRRCLSCSILSVQTAGGKEELDPTGKPQEVNRVRRKNRTLAKEEKRGHTHHKSF